MMSQGKRALIGSISEVDQLEQLCSQLDLNHLVDRLVEGGIVSRVELDAMLTELEVPSGQLSTSHVADELLRRRRVSLYQLWAAVSGQQHKLMLGEYTVVEPLGAGGMGEVLLAVHRRMKRKVAIKFLPTHFADDEEMVKRFEREVEVAAQLSHPNIVTAYDAGHTGNTRYLVMEYVDGCDLRSLIHASGPLTCNQALKCVLQAGKGIAHAHQKGVIHRDIKPSNLLADRDGTIKVLDMGLARWSNEAAQSAASDLSVTGAVMGTIDFMSPEQAASAKNADARSDIYSLGCTLYMLINGRPVFPGETVIEKIVAHQNADVPDLLEGDNERSTKLNLAVRRMLAKKPDERFATMDAACAALSECLEEPSHDTKLTLQIPDRTPIRSDALQETKDKRPEASYISTLDFSDQPAIATQTSSGGGMGKWRGMAIAAVIALLLACAGALGVPTILKLLTPDGTLVVKCHVEGAIVEVDGKRMIRVSDPDSQDEYRFELPKGEHTVRATLPDGTEIKSGTIEITSKNETLFDVSREKAPRGPLQIAKDRPRTTSPDDDPDVLTVAQDGSAEFDSITSAVTEVRRGQTIRIVDGATYEESLDLQSSQRFNNVTIEATGGAKWLSSPSSERILGLRNIQGFTLRGLDFKIRAGGAYGVLFADFCAGARVDNCSFAAADPRLGTGRPLLSMEGIKHEVGQPPVVISNCQFESANGGLQIMGMLMDGHRPLRCGGILVRDCTFTKCGVAVGCLGELHDAWIVNNVFSGSLMGGIQFQHLLGNPTNVVISNNSMLNVPSAIRIWEDGVKKAAVEIHANVTLTSSSDEWLAWDSGGDDMSAKGPANGPAFQEAWNFSRNYREGQRPPADWPLLAGWIPPAPDSNLLERIEVMSRDPSDDNYLRPPAASQLATGGVGGSFPDYAGAVPPDSATSFDWELAFERSLVLSRVPEDVITVAKEEIAHFQTINHAIDAAEPGMTIRVLDDAIYQESLAFFSKHGNITLEAINGATLAATASDVVAIRMQSVADVSIRGFRIEMGASYLSAIHLQGSCPGVTLESLAISGADAASAIFHGVNLVWLANRDPRRPVIVNRCTIEGVHDGIRISGLADDYQGFETCQRIAVTNNRISSVGKGIVIYGDVRNIFVAGNVVHKAKFAALQLEQLGPQAENIVLVNNTLADSTCGVRLWSRNEHGRNVKAINNFTFDTAHFGWGYLNSGGSPTQAVGPGDIGKLKEDWTFRYNFRESGPIAADDPTTRARIPPGEDDTVQQRVALVSRDFSNSSFARPAPESPLATGGAGGAYPTYVGAIPPDPDAAFDWTSLINQFFQGEEE